MKHLLFWCIKLPCRLSLAFNSKISLAIIITNRLKELEISAKLVFTYHILLDTQRMSFISVKLLAIEEIYNEVFNSIFMPLEWHFSALMGSMRSAVFGVCVHTQC